MDFSVFCANVNEFYKGRAEKLRTGSIEQVAVIKWKTEMNAFVSKHMEARMKYFLR